MIPGKPGSTVETEDLEESELEEGSGQEGRLITDPGGTRLRAE